MCARTLVPSAPGSVCSAEVTSWSVAESHYTRRKALPSPLLQWMSEALLHLGSCVCILFVISKLRIKHSAAQGLNPHMQDLPFQQALLMMLTKLYSLIYPLSQRVTGAAALDPTPLPSAGPQCPEGCHSVPAPAGTQWKTPGRVSVPQDCPLHLLREGERPSPVRWTKQIFDILHAMLVTEKACWS